jgi:hypothetical protein
LIGRRVDNFTAYYNTFYNARKSFDSGVDERSRGLRRADQSTITFLSHLPGAGRSGQSA